MGMAMGLSWIINLGVAVIWGIFAVLACSKGAKWLLTPAIVLLGARVFSMLFVGVGYMGRGVPFALILNLIPPVLLIIALFLRKGPACFLFSLIAGCLEGFLLVVSLMSGLRFMFQLPGMYLFSSLSGWLIQAALVLCALGVALRNRRSA